MTAERVERMIIEEFARCEGNGYNGYLITSDTAMVFAHRVAERVARELAIETGEESSLP